MVLTAISGKGQVVISKRIIAGLGFSKNSKRILISDKGDLSMKKISKSNIQARKLLDTFSDKFKKEGIKETDLKKEIQSYRHAK